jgi:uncharacterized membrane protein
MSIGEIKRLARETLKASYGKCALAILGLLVFFSVLTYGTVLISNYIQNSGLTLGIALIESLLYLFVLLGMYSYFLKLSRGEEAKLSDIFGPKEKFYKYLIAQVCIILIAVILTTIVSRILMGFGIKAFVHDGINSASSLLLVLVVAIIIYIPAIFIGVLFSQLPFVFLDNKDMDLGALISKTMDLIKGSKMKYFLMLLSFMLWYVLILIIGLLIGNVAIGAIIGIVCGLFLLFYVLPYIFLAQAFFYSYIIEHEKEETGKDAKEE